MTNPKPLLTFAATICLWGALKQPEYLECFWQVFLTDNVKQYREQKRQSLLEQVTPVVQIILAKPYGSTEAFLLKLKQHFCFDMSEFHYFCGYDKSVVVWLANGLQKVTVKAPCPSSDFIGSTIAAVLQNDASNDVLTNSERLKELADRSDTKVISAVKRAAPLQVTASKLISPLPQDWMIDSSTGSATMVTKAKLATLIGDQWLNDEVINAYFLLLQIRDDKLRKAEASHAPCLFSHSFLCKQLFNVHDQNPNRWGKPLLQTASRIVSRLTKGRSLMTYARVFIPFNGNEDHWSCFVIFPNKRLVSCYDSLRRECSVEMRMVFQLLQAHYSDVNKGAKLPDATEWRLEPKPHGVPQQTDGCSCGVYACMFAEQLSLGRTLSIDKEDIQGYRGHIAQSIIKGEIVC